MMIRLNTKNEEIICWTIALGLHCLLLLWHAVPYQMIEADPIISVDFIVEQMQPLGYKAGPEGGGEEAKGLFKRIKKMLGFADKARQEATSADQLATGDLSQKIQSNSQLKDFEKRPNLKDKEAKTSFKGFSKDKLDSSTEDLQSSADASQIQVASKNKIDVNTEKLSDKQYQVAKRDLPFDIARAPTGELATGSLDRPDNDAPVIAVGKKTSKGVRDISTNVVDKGSYSGGGSGDSLSGTGGFSGIAVSKTGGSGSLSGAGNDGGYGGSIIGQEKTYGGGRGSGTGGFAGAGSTEGGADGGELGQGSGLATGGGGTGTKKGGGGGNNALFELSGPLSNRQIIKQVIPEYPEWAKKKGIMATVSLYFFVLHTGVVKDNIVIQRTSGYPLLDKTAMDALIQWKFAPLSKEQYGKEQWGIITFKFKIR
ncbi:MAG: energy transducer TonB [bacterium]